MNSPFLFRQWGVPEDPVTGSAHCCLFPFREKKASKKEVLAVSGIPPGRFSPSEDWGQQKSSIWRPGDNGPEWDNRPVIKKNIIFSRTGTTEYRVPVFRSHLPGTAGSGASV